MIPVAGSALQLRLRDEPRAVRMRHRLGGIFISEYCDRASTIAVGWSGNFGSILQDMGLHFPRRHRSARARGSAPDGTGATSRSVQHPDAVLDVTA